MNEHFRILELGTRDALPEIIDETSEFSVQIVRELVDAGYLTAIDGSSMDGAAYLEPRITLAGREYLRRSRQTEQDAGSLLIAKLQRLRDKMAAVSTGGPRIDDMNAEYRELYREADRSLQDPSRSWQSAKALAGNQVGPRFLCPGDP